MKIPPALRDLPRPLYLFDGYCVLCSGFVNFCLAHDGDGQLKFASTQSALGTRVVKALDLPPDALDHTVLLIEGDEAVMRSTAALRSMRHLKGWPAWLRLLLVIPAFIRDPAYNLVARNRYRWFGQRDTCHRPDEATRPRFIDL